MTDLTLKDLMKSDLKFCLEILEAMAESEDE
jgi:hypothetical protein